MSKLLSRRTCWHGQNFSPRTTVTMSTTAACPIAGVIDHRVAHDRPGRALFEILGRGLSLVDQVREIQASTFNT